VIAAPASANVHSLVAALVADEKTRSTFIAFYVGAADPIFVAENERLDRELTAAGLRHTFAVYAGGHETKLWSSHAVAWMRLALAHLAPATT
jgi:enterochelin esterase-like enzyme